MKNDLVGLIYEAAFDASRWQEVVKSLATQTNSTGGQLLFWDSHSNGAAFSLMAGCASDPDTADRLYAEHYGAIDPRRQHAMKMPVGHWLTCHSICDERFVAGSEFYQDYFIPVIGGRYMCGTRLADQHGMNAMLAAGGVRRAIRRFAPDGSHSAACSFPEGRGQPASRADRDAAESGFAGHLKGCLDSRDRPFLAVRFAPLGRDKRA